METRGDVPFAISHEVEGYSIENRFIDLPSISAVTL